MTPTNDNATAGLVERLRAEAVDVESLFEDGTVSATMTEAADALELAARHHDADQRTIAAYRAAQANVLAERDALQARLAEVEQQRDEASDQADEWCKVARAALSREKEAKAEAMRLREALTPFAFTNPDEPDTTQQAWETRYRDRFQDWISFEEIEAARAALAQSSGADAGGEDKG